MTTITLCPDLPLPTYKAIYDAIMAAVADLLKPRFTFPDPDFTYPPFTLSIPALPTLPSYGFGDKFKSEIAHLEQFINELCSNQILTVLGIIIDKLKEYLAVDIPEIPGLGIDLPGLMAWDIDTVFPTLIIPTFPALPSNLVSPSMDKLRSLQMLIVNYIFALVELIKSKLDDLRHILFPDPLVPPGLPTFPTIPTWDDIVALLPARPTLNDLMALSILGLDLSTIIPNPLLPLNQLGSYDVTQALMALMKKLSTLPLQIILDFLHTLGLTVSIPTICFPISY